MLRTGFEEKLSSRLDTGFGLTSTTLTEVGLEIQLAANSSYWVELLVQLNSVLSTGSKLGLYYTGTWVLDNDTVVQLRPIVVGGVPTYPISAGSAQEDTTPENVYHFAGTVLTSTSGRLYVKAAKRSGADDDFPILAGSCLTARRL